MDEEMVLINKGDLNLLVSAIEELVELALDGAKPGEGSRALLAATYGIRDSTKPVQHWTAPRGFETPGTWKET